MALALAIAGLQIAVVRPYLWPAGAGIALSGESVLSSLGTPGLVPRVSPPELASVAGQPVTVARANPTAAASFNLPVGTIVTGFYDAAGRRVDLSRGLPNDAAGLLRVWRRAYYLGTQNPVTLSVGHGAVTTLQRDSVWRADSATRAMWFSHHAGPLLKVIGFLIGALVLVSLGTRGMTARLMTLALVATAIATGGPLYGMERTVPIVGGLLLLMVWTATPLAFPIIGLAVLHFPTRAAILDRHPWIYPALALATAPMLGISLLTAGFLLGFDQTLPALSWVAMNGWAFDLSFAISLAANLLIVIEGVRRYRANADANERRRIQLVVYAGVAAVFAYAINSLVPLLSSLAGRPVQLPWMLQAALQTIVLLPAFALPYAVAVRRVLSPRTVLRRSMQYALARGTLSILIALPVAALVIALVSNRDRSLSDIIIGQPLFYAAVIALAAVGFRYRDRAQRWLDRRFFRAEYDGREILVTLASRVPFETDPAQLVAMVVSQIDDALQPEAVAVLAGDDEHMAVVAARRTEVGALARDSGLATLLRWSEDPLEVFLDDEQAQAARLPGADRAWLAASGLSLLVPILAGNDERRLLAGVIGLGQKRSEEPYTREDRRLLRGIAAQMSAALDLSRLRRRLSTSPAEAPAVTTLPQADLAAMPSVVDGKYRIDALIGRGGMGAVYRAHDLRLARDVALKVVRAELVAQSPSRARFEREAQIIARLQHPAIVTVFDYGTMADGAAFLVMEYVRGEDLRSLLKREGRLSVDRAIELVARIAGAIDFAHRAGVLHRDLKPENILLPDSGLGPKVVDFGVAKITDTAAEGGKHTLTHGGTIIGTPAYMAPEQLRGESVDARADVYSLAVLTYEALTGRLPFGGGSLVEIGIKQADGSDRVDFSDIPPGIAVPLARALSLSREQRPPSAAAFANSMSSSSPSSLSTRA
jgi:eukaryotic-like serine/threonine-protein kinase